MVLKVIIQYSIPGTSFIKKRRNRPKRPIQEVLFTDADNSVLTLAIVLAIVAAASVVVCSWLADLIAAAKTSVELAAMEDMVSDPKTLNVVSCAGFYRLCTYQAMIVAKGYEFLDPIVASWLTGRASLAILFTTELSVSEDGDRICRLLS